MNDAPNTRASPRTSKIRPLSWPIASLRTYLVVMILLALVPLAALMSYQVVGQVETQRKRTQEEMQHGAAVLAQSINRELLSSIVALNVLAYSGEIQRGEVEAFAQSLLQRPPPQASWSGVYLASLDGEVLFNTAAPVQKGQKKVRDDAEFLRLVKDHQAIISNIVPNGDGSGFTTSIEVPVLIDGAPRFVLGATIPTTIWQQLTEDSGLAAPGVSAIIDREFRIIARSRISEQFGGTLAPEANRTIMYGQPAGTGRLVSLEGGYLHAAWDTVALGRWTVLAGTPAAPVDAIHRRTIAMAIATVVGCLLLGIFLALRVARRMTQPLRQLARNDLSSPPVPIAVREISMLRDALVTAQVHDKMASELISKKRDLLAKRADEFETLLSGSPIGLAFAQDSQCQTVTQNTAMTALFGPADPEDDDSVTVLHEGRPLAREEQPLQRAAANGESTSSMELEVRREGRPPAFVLVNAVPLRDEQGQPRGAIGAVVDITERKATEARLISAEQRLRESQNLVDLAQETGHVGFFHYQIEERDLAWTPGQAKLFDIDASADHLPLAVWTQRIDRIDWRRIARALCRAFAAGREMENLDYRVHLPDGRSRWLSSRVRLIYSFEGRPQHIIGVTVDMTEQKRAESERDALIVCEQEARILAEEANRAKDEFLAMLGHELRNPLSAIASGIEVLNRVDGGTEAASNARRIIGRQTRHLAHMVDDLLDVARVMTDQVALPRHNFDLAAIVQRVIAALELSGEFNEHELVPDIHSVWVDANPTRIEQVISNLIVNAIKYTPPGGRIEVRVRADGEDGANALFEVRDNGVGIAPELLPRVFDLFVQGDRTLDRRNGGLGVGLTLARRLVELHGGSIHADNANPGTVMCVRLPAVSAPLPAAEQPPARELRQRRIAIVEDNEDVLEGLRTVLELHGHVVWTASDGINGLALILSTRPDVAIVDIGLPGLTGFEVARRSRGGGYPGKMIALSGYGHEDDKQQTQAAGFDAHFLKPVSSSELLGLIVND
jgi:PAS domain S-box-containing protein